MLILASKSPRRSELLNNLNIPFESIPPDYDEIHEEHPFSNSIPLELAYNKAASIARRFPDSIVIGVDTIVYNSNKVYGKPSDLNEAFQILHELSGKVHKVISGVAILCLNKFIRCAFTDESHVKFKNLNDNIIREYFKAMNPLDKAGAYAIQENGDMIVDYFTGSYDNIIGLPTEKLMTSLNLINRI